MKERHALTIYTGLFKATIDYIFYNPDCLNLVSVLQMPDEDILKAQNCLPSKLFPSDHMRIEAIFEFNGRYKSAAKTL